jgi:predicted transcriptional regulator of viral defense system
VKSNSEQLLAKNYIDQLASSGRYHFTSADARVALRVSPDAAKLAINRLKRQGLIAAPVRGFHVIVPPEFRSLGCLPADHFIPALMEQKDLIYYAGLLSAAQYYGAAHQRPQEFQVFLAKNHRPIECGKVRVKFIARKRVKEVPVRKFNTRRGQIHVSTPEVTAIDLAGYPQHAGGLDQVATILSELANEIEPDRLSVAAATAPVSWAQRLGYLLEIVDAGHITEALKKHVKEHAREYTTLAPGTSTADGKRQKNWKLVINVELDPDI